MGIHEREPGVWQISADLPRERGERRKQRYATVHGTKAQAKRAEKALQIRAVTEGRKAKPSPLTVGEYLDEWLRTAVEPNLRPGSVKSYRTVAENLRPHIGGIPLRALAPLDIERAYVKLREGRSGTTLRHHHNVLAIALRRAVAWGMIPHTPMDGVTPPTPDSRPRQAHTLEQARALITAILSHPSRVRLILGLACGMRAGEVLALQWRDLDCEALVAGRACVATVRRSWSQAGQCYGPTKTGRERRFVLPEVAALILREEYSAQERRREAEPAWNPDGLVACGHRGSVRYHNLASTVRALCESLGLPALVYHGLRHTIASIRVDSGENPAQIADELGHDREQLLRVYSHLSEEGFSEAAKRVDGALRG